MGTVLECSEPVTKPCSPPLAPWAPRMKATWSWGHGGHWQRKAAALSKEALRPQGKRNHPAQSRISHDLALKSRLPAKKELKSMNFHSEQMMFLEYMKHLLPDIDFYHMANALLSLLNTLAATGSHLAVSYYTVTEKSALMKRIGLASWGCSDGGTNAGTRCSHPVPVSELHHAACSASVTRERLQPKCRCD